MRPACATWSCEIARSLAPVRSMPRSRPSGTASLNPDSRPQPAKLPTQGQTSELYMVSPDSRVVYGVPGFHRRQGVQNRPREGCRSEGTKPAAIGVRSRRSGPSRTTPRSHPGRTSPSGMRRTPPVTPAQRRHTMAAKPGSATDDGQGADLSFQDALRIPPRRGALGLLRIIPTDVDSTTIGVVRPWRNRKSRSNPIPPSS